MCTGAEAPLISAIAGGTAAAAGIAASEDARRRAKGAAEESERQKLQATRDAANRTAAKNQLQRRALRDNSLTTGAGVATPDAGRATLGV